MKKNHIKEKSQAALTIGEAKPALSGRSEGEGARPTHYYWSSHGRETNSFGKGGHERGNGKDAQRIGCDKRGYGWTTDRGHSTHTDAPTSPQDAPGTVGADRSSKGRWGAMEGSESGAGKGGRVNVFNSAANSGSAAKNESKSQFGRLRRLGSLMRFFSFISRPRLWVWFGAGERAPEHIPVNFWPQVLTSNQSVCKSLDLRAPARRNRLFLLDPLVDSRGGYAHGTGKVCLPSQNIRSLLDIIRHSLIIRLSLIYVNRDCLMRVA